MVVPQSLAQSVSTTNRSITNAGRFRTNSANYVVGTVWNWMSDTRGMRAGTETSAVFRGAKGDNAVAIHSPALTPRRGNNNLAQGRADAALRRHPRRPGYANKPRDKP